MIQAPPRGFFRPRAASSLAIAALAALLVLPPLSLAPAVPPPAHAAQATTAWGAAPTGSRVGAGAVGSPRAPARDGGLAEGVSPREVFPPSPPIPNSRSRGGELVGWSGNPAPMGLADLGRGISGSYLYNTSSFMASITFNSPFSSYSPGYSAFAEAPNWATIQLNTVAVNVSYPHAPNGFYGTFWVQNVVHFNGSTLELEDNVWNFTGTAGLGPGTLLNPQGTISSGQYYFRNGPTISSLTYPFTLELVNSIALVSHHAVVHLNYTLVGRQSGSYDAVTFAQTQTATPWFQVNGVRVDGANHWNDAEVIFGGDGSGSNAMVQGINATVSLRYWYTLASSWTTVPSAYDFGLDSGETAEGIAVTYDATNHVESLLQGPSMLYGLWGTTPSFYGPTAYPGAVRVQVTVSPGSGFVFATDNNSLTSRPLAEANLAYFPTGGNGVGVTALPPPPAADPYELLAWAAGYRNSSTAPTPVTNSSSGVPLTIHLSTAFSSPIEAPVYLVGDTEASTLGTVGIPSITYSASNQTLSVSASTDALAPPFLRLNDFHYPTFVLFAANDLNISVRIDRFAQAAAASTYTIDQGVTVVYPGYSQGYFFFYGTGTFDVTNTTLPGNTSAYWQNEAYPPAAVEFFQTNGGHASHITSSQESFGVTFVNTTGGSASNVTSTLGANALSVVNARDVSATDVRSTGVDYMLSPTWGAYLLAASGIRIDRLTSSQGSVALETGNSSWTVDGLSAANATAIQAIDCDSSTVAGLAVADGPPSPFYGGYWDNSTGVTIGHLSVVGLGLELAGDTDVSAVGVNASGPGSTAVYSFLGSNEGSFSFVNATDLALALNLSGATNLSLQAVDATDGSVGVYMFGANGTVATGVDASGLSVGLLWQVGANGTITGARAADESIPVALTNLTNVTVSEVTATNATMGPAYFLSPYIGFFLPDAAVWLGNVTNSSVTDVWTSLYAFAVLENYSDGLTLSDVAAFNGLTGVWVDTSNNTTLSEIFSYGERVGVDLNNSTNVTIVASVFEDSVSYGVAALNGSALAVNGSDFLANNGASAVGIYSGAHVQASITGTTLATFHSNYWSDDGSRSPYVVNRTRSDRTPLANFTGPWLLFAETGLGSGDRWTVGAFGVRLNTATSMVYLPAWAVPAGPQPFVVLSPTGFVASPDSSVVTFLGSNLTVRIQFNSTTSATGNGGLNLPVWALAAAAVAAIAAAVGAALALRRSRAPTEPEAQQPAAPHRSFFAKRRVPRRRTPSRRR